MKHPIPELALGLLLPLLRSVTVRELSPSMGDELARELVNDAWRRYRDLEDQIPDEKTVGAGVMVHLSAFTVGIFQALQAHGLSEPEARARTAGVTWAVYKRICALPWAFTSPGARSPLGRVKRAMDLFMLFPYGSPGYEMAYVETGSEVVGFDVHRCPAAEFFAAQSLSALCKEAFCDLDYPLANMWGVELERCHTLSTGAKCCDFRFRSRREGSGQTGCIGPLESET